jgi:hypothetical protein
VVGRGAHRRGPTPGSWLPGVLLPPDGTLLAVGRAKHDRRRCSGPAAGIAPGLTLLGSAPPSSHTPSWGGRASAGVAGFGDRGEDRGRGRGGRRVW